MPMPMPMRRCERQKRQVNGRGMHATRVRPGKNKCAVPVVWFYRQSGQSEFLLEACGFAVKNDALQVKYLGRYEKVGRETS